MKRIAFLLAIILLSLASCRKESDTKSDSFILTGIKNAKGSEIVTVKIDSGVIHSVPIDCHILGSTVYDPTSGGYGYVDCDSMFNLVNPATGTLIRSFKVPGFLSQCVIDDEENTLIGFYSVFLFKGGSKSSQEMTITNYVVKIALESGEILANNTIDVGDGVYGCICYFNQEEKGYVLERADNTLITINPSTGEIVKSVSVGTSISGAIYNPDDKTIIGFTYLAETDRNYIKVINAETGEQILSTEIKQRDNYLGCISGYDPVNNSYILVNADNEVLFIDTSTGEISKSYKLPETMSDIRFRKE